MHFSWSYIIILSRPILSLQILTQINDVVHVAHFCPDFIFQFHKAYGPRLTAIGLSQTEDFLWTEGLFLNV